jgi:hypothetical protein
VSGLPVLLGGESVRERERERKRERAGEREREVHSSLSELPPRLVKGRLGFRELGSRGLGFRG